MNKRVTLTPPSLMSVLLIGVIVPLLLASTAFAIDCNPACVNGACNTIAGICTCPTDTFLTFTDTRCDNVSIIAPGGTASQLTRDSGTFLQSQQVNFADTVFQGGFPISDGVTVKSLFVCSNGYVTFDSNYCATRIDLLRNAAAPSFIAPFATSFDYRSTVGAVSSDSNVTYELVKSIDAVSRLSQMRTHISELANTTSAIVITWSKMSPPTLEFSKTVQQITIQLIIFTDMQKVTTAAMLYSSNSLKHYFDWVPTLIAWKTSGSLTTLAGTRSAAMAYANQAVSYNTLKTRLRILPIYRNNSASINYAAMCSSEAVTALLFTPSSTVASSCPQTQQQARSDPRYTQDTVAVAGKQTYKLLQTANVENVTQLTCVYHNATGGLLVQDSSIKVVSNNVSLGANLYDYCCSKAPALCSLYYNKFPQPSSSSYAAPGSAGFVTGAGLFRTFDKYQFKFMAIGDYWLVHSANLKVQIRMENLGMPATNNTAAVTAVAAQFTGTTNITTSIEVFRHKSTAQISNWHFSVNQSQYQNFTGAAQTKFLSDVGIIVSSSKLICYMINSNSLNNWIEISSAPNGLTVSVFLTKSPGTVKGPLGNSDTNSQNDVVDKNGTVLNATQQANQTLLNEVLKTWTVSPANESLFMNSQTELTAAANWTPLYWDSAWDTNQTALTLALFSGNATTIYNASLATCSARSGNTTEYRHCLLEFSDCKFQSTCSSAYLNLLESLTALACSPPRWNATTTPLNVKEGLAFSLELPTLVDGGGSGRTFLKISGPSGLNVTENGSLTWVPAQSDASALILLSVTDRTSGCASLWPVPIRLTRRDGLCSANATEALEAPLASGSAVTPQNQAAMSSCTCKQNYYGSSCSFATCPLNCYACTSTPATNCSSTCPTNYDQSSSSGVTICAYRDRCDNSACTGGAYTGCISADPAIQTDSNKYQCICAAGFQYPLSNPANKTICEDINECVFSTYCDTSKNRTCTNNAPGFSCLCSDGFEPVNATCLTGQCSCQDIDECKKNSSICLNGNCINTIGSYRCNCSTGYYAETSQKCSDIDECSNPYISKCTHTCVNTPGSFNCTCKNGFAHPSGDLVTCTAQLNCTANSCTYSDMCARVNVTDTCYCLPNQTGSGQTCTPTTYCTAGLCGVGGNCSEVGSPASKGYNCICEPHYEKNERGVCIKKQYCSDSSKYPGVCPVGGKFDCTTNSTTNAPTCTCSSGYAITNSSERICADVNECEKPELNACDRSSADCFNEIGFYTCNCKFGYKRINNTHCSPAPYVYLVNGTFTDLTFTPDMGIYLSDAFNKTSELLQKKFEAALPPDGNSVGAGPPTTRVFALSSGSVVAGIVASFNSPTTPEAIKAMSASTGLTVTVTNVNECVNASLNDCSTEHICENTETGYKCKCKTGYTQTGIRYGFPVTKEIADCVDVDECLLECKGVNKVCVNTPGNYSCSCVNGTYSSNPRTGPCEDPCVPGRCQFLGVCQYQKSDQFPFKCICPAGYTGFTCELRDENYFAMERNVLIVGVVLGVLLLIALIIVVCCIIRNRNSGGNYRGTQTMAMAETSIPRAKESAKHPSAYQNHSFERDNARQRNDYF